MEFSRQEYWSGLPFPSPRDLPDPGLKPRSSVLQADFFFFFFFFFYHLSHQGSPCLGLGATPEYDTEEYGLF